MDPLACGDDSLNNNHANTHLPEVVGVARGWEVTQNATLATITANFHSILSEHYSYATGGSNVNEHWSSPDQLGDAVATSFNADEEPTNSNGFHVRRSASRSPAPSLTGCLLRGRPRRLARSTTRSRSCATSSAGNRESHANVATTTMAIEASGCVGRSASIGDQYEIKLNNGILGVQQPGVVGSMSYMTP